MSNLIKVILAILLAIILALLLWCKKSKEQNEKDTPEIPSSPEDKSENKSGDVAEHGYRFYFKNPNSSEDAMLVVDNQSAYILITEKLVGQDIITFNIVDNLTSYQASFVKNVYQENDIISFNQNEYNFRINTTNDFVEINLSSDVSTSIPTSGTSSQLYLVDSNGNFSLSNLVLVHDDKTYIIVTDKVLESVGPSNSEEFFVQNRANSFVADNVSEDISNFQEDGNDLDFNHDEVSYNLNTSTNEVEKRQLTQ